MHCGVGAGPEPLPGLRFLPVAANGIWATSGNAGAEASDNTVQSRATPTFRALARIRREDQLRRAAGV